MKKDTKFELKNYQALMQELLTKKEIKMIKEQAALEFKSLKWLQTTQHVASKNHKNDKEKKNI